MTCSFLHSGKLEAALYVSLAIDSHSQEVLTMAAETLPLVWLLGTGGTISLWAPPRLRFVEHETGQRIDVHQNLERIPEAQQFVQTKAEQLFFADSLIKTPELLELSNKINAIFNENPDVSGIVVTHGTYTMEETAYWLHLTVRSDRPVVVTGCQRPPSAMGTDADNNLLGSLILAGSEEARGKGVMICMNDEINAAREVTKTNSHRLETFQSRELGFLGYLDSDLRAKFYRQSTRKHTYQSEFDISDLKDLPRVDIVYDYQDSDGVAVRAFAQAGAQGIVLAGRNAGGGLGTRGTQEDPGLSSEALRDARDRGLAVVATNRNGAGQMIRSSRERELGVVAGDNLSAQKARILLRLALTKTRSPEEIQRMFDTY